MLKREETTGGTRTEAGKQAPTGPAAGPVRLVAARHERIPQARHIREAAAVAEPHGDYVAQPEQAASGSTGVINGSAVADRLLPAHHEWAWRKYLHACAHHWLPQQLELDADIAMWSDPHTLSTDEREIVRHSLGQLSGTCFPVTDNLVLAMYRHITSPECRQYLLRQVYEDSLHVHASQHVIAALGLDEGEITGRYRGQPATARREAWFRGATSHLADPQFSTGTAQADQTLLGELIAYYVIHEGIFFHLGFPQVLSLGRRKRMIGTCQLLRHVLQGELAHAAFGIDLVNQIKIENPQLWTEAFKEQVAHMLREAVRLQTACIYEGMPRGILGLNAPMLEEYLRHIANRRCAQIGIDELYPGATNPLAWMSEMEEDEQQQGNGEAGICTTADSHALCWD